LTWFELVGWSDQGCSPGPNRTHFREQGAQGADQAGEGGAGRGGGGGGALGEGAQHQVGCGVDQGPLIAGDRPDHGRGGVPEGLEAAHGSDGCGDIAALHFTLALLEQIEHGGYGLAEGGLAGGGGGGFGGLTGGGGGILGGLAYLVTGLAGGFLGAGATGDGHGGHGGNGDRGATDGADRAHGRKAVFRFLLEGLGRPASFVGISLQPIQIQAPV